VRVARQDGAGFVSAIAEPSYDGALQFTAISAWDDTVIVGYRDSMTNGLGLSYRISYTEGTGGWSIGTLYTPGVADGPVIDFDFCARGGFGTSAVYSLELGEPDEVWFTKRPGYAPGAWDAAVEINDVDVFTGVEAEINWVSTIDGSSNNHRFGIVYVQPDAKYDRRQHCDGDVDESGSVNVNDLIAVILDWGACLGCPPSCEADIAPFGGNCTVDVDDLIEVILSWGVCP
jgi:hypothetical protein